VLVHNVYFSLKDPTPAAAQRLLDACRKYLADHSGVVYFGCGTPCDLDRPVNDRNFEVGLHIVFSDRAAHDRYQQLPQHLQFIAENKDTWRQVRVFDSDA